MRCGEVGVRGDQTRQVCPRTCGLCPPSSLPPPCVDIGFPEDPDFKCADEAEACNDTSDLEWYNELRQICAKTCNACGPVTG